MKIQLWMLLVFSLVLVQAKAQDMPFYTLNAAGSYGTINNQLYDFSIGEMVMVNTFSTTNILLSQGFLQPYDVTHVLATADVRLINNVITPNGDGKNDVLLIEGLSQYPGSKLSIYNRAGQKIYAATDYQNDWNGMINGLPLNEDTYYYVIDRGKEFGLIKGFISVILDLPNQ